MTERWKVRTVAAMLTATLALGMPASEALAKKKSSITARIGGKRFKATGRRVTGSYGNLILVVGGGSLKGRTSRAIAIGCVPLDLATAVLPHECQNATGTNYQEVTLRRPPTTKGWINTAEGIRVTIDFYDGVRIRGRFSGTFGAGVQNGGGALPPLSIEDGKFDVIFPRQ
jgi:hypothetical protein